jgi:hypothetical protein
VASEASPKGPNHRERGCPQRCRRSTSCSGKEVDSRTEIRCSISNYRHIVARYQQLDAEAVRDTARAVEARITARFPDRQLRVVAGEVTSMFDRLTLLQQRQHRLRILRWVCMVIASVLVLLALAAVVFVIVDGLDDADGLGPTWLSVIESGVNDVVFAGIAAAFLLAIPRRIGRDQILKELHRLRSLAHVIDMHQLTKDPERELSQPKMTEASVRSTLNPIELGRYLDYCSELLSLVSKNAALYAQVSTDSVVLDTVSEIEALTNGLSRKVWQKISILHTR